MFTPHRRPRPNTQITPKLLSAFALLLTFSFTSAPTHAAGLLVADGGFGGVLEIKNHDVKVTINNAVAITQVNQTFLNTENRIVEALYTFPVPKGASVANFSMWINGKEMIGEVVEKQRAKQIYESYKQTRRDPGLLEQVDYKTFEMRIFPIPARAEQRVQITYYQQLDTDHDTATYVYPLATTTTANTNQTTTEKMALTLEVKSEIPITEMNSPSHPNEFAIASHTENYHQASLETRTGSLQQDIVIHYQTKRPQTGFDIITSKTDSEDGYFMLTLTAGQDLAALDQPMDYLFVLDTSGSMANDSKMALSRNSILAFIEQLDPKDRFDLITFNIQANPMFSELRPAGDSATQATSAFLDKQFARGGTNLKPALQTAYNYATPDRPLNVIILSDGMTEQSEQRQLLQLIEQRPPNCRVFTIGVGNEVNRPLLDQLARETGGLASFLSPADDIQRQAKAFRRKLMHPAASNPVLSFNGANVYDVEPQTLPNLYHGSPVRIFGRYRNPGPVSVNVQAEVLGAPFKQNVDIDLPKADPNNPEIERMWAYNRVQRLMDEDRSTGSKGAVDQIVNLCEGYSIVSEYASFIVLENDAEYARWKIERRNATRIHRDRTAQANLRTQLDSLRQSTADQLGPAPTNPTTPTTLASTKPSIQTPSPTIQSSPTPRPAAPSKSRGFNLNIPSLGGGAIDPITGTLLLLSAGAGLKASRKKRNDTNDHINQPKP